MINTNNLINLLNENNIKFITYNVQLNMLYCFKNEKSKIEKIRNENNLHFNIATY